MKNLRSSFIYRLSHSPSDSLSHSKHNTQMIKVERVLKKVFPKKIILTLFSLSPIDTEKLMRRYLIGKENNGSI
jgi:hypothetical protein